MVDFTIRVIVEDGQAVKKIKGVSRALGRAEDSGKRLGTVLKRAFLFVATGLAVREFINFSNAALEIRNRLVLVNDVVADTEGAFQRLKQISLDTRSPLRENVSLFQRAAQAAGDLGASTDDMFRFVRAAGTALAIMGGQAGTARGALIQLSQAIGATRVRAEEFNSILEGALPLAQAAARGIEETGGSVARLRQLIILGNLSSRRFFQAILGEAETLAAQFAKTIPTISQAFQNLRTEGIDAAKRFNEATGAAEFLAKTIIGLANNLKTLVDGLITAANNLDIVATIIVTFLIRALVLMEVSIVSRVLPALATFSTALQLLVIRGGAATVAISIFNGVIRLLGGPIAAIVTLVGALAAGFLLMRDTSESLAEKMSRLVGGVAQLEAGLILTQVAAGEYGKAIAATATTQDAATRTILVNTRKEFEAKKSLLELELKRQIATQAERLVVLAGIEDVIAASERQLSLVKELGAETKEGTFLGFETAGVGDGSEIKTLTDNLDTLRDSFKGLRAESDLAEVAIDRTKEALGTDFAEASEAGAAAFTKLSDSLDGTKDSADDLTFRDIIQGLKDEQEILLLSGVARAVRIEQLRAEADLERKLTPTEDALIELYVRENETIDALNQTRDSYIEGLRQLSEEMLNQITLFEDGVIGATAFRNAMLENIAAAAEFRISIGEGSFADGFISEMVRMTEAGRNFTAETGILFAQFVGNFSKSFGDAIAGAILGTENFKESLKAAAREGIGQLISSFIQLGIQWVASQILALTLGAAATAAGVTQAGILATAWATPAALASLASYGANAGPASAGLILTVGLAKSLAAIGGLADGGLFSGKGGPTADGNLIRISDGEFVVNAAATRKNLILLESINEGQFDRLPREVTFAKGGLFDSERTSRIFTGNSSITNDASPANTSSTTIIEGDTITLSPRFNFETADAVDEFKETEDDTLANMSRMLEQVTRRRGIRRR